MPKLRAAAGDDDIEEPTRQQEPKTNKLRTSEDGHRAAVERHRRDVKKLAEEQRRRGKDQRSYGFAMFLCLFKIGFFVMGLGIAVSAPSEGDANAVLNAIVLSEAVMMVFAMIFLACYNFAFLALIVIAQLVCSITETVFAVYIGYVSNDCYMYNCEWAMFSSVSELSRFRLVFYLLLRSVLNGMLILLVVAHSPFAVEEDEAEVTSAKVASLLSPPHQFTCFMEKKENCSESAVESAET